MFCVPLSTCAGTQPSGFTVAEISVLNLNAPPPFTYRISPLTPGVEVWARVTARNERGYGLFMLTAPVSEVLPIQLPTAPLSPYYAGGETSLRVSVYCLFCGA